MPIIRPPFSPRHGQNATDDQLMQQSFEGFLRSPASLNRRYLEPEIQIESDTPYQVIETALQNHAEFNRMTQNCAEDGRRPVLGHTGIKRGTLNWPVVDNKHGPIFVGRFRSHQIEDVTVITAVIGTETRVKITIRNTTFEGEVINNHFAKANLSRDVFKQAVLNNNFLGANFFAAQFEQAVSNCNFSGATLDNATFSETVSGLTSFAGANLKNVSFPNEIGDQVIFIGAHFDDTQAPVGGIHTIQQLRVALENSIFTAEEVQNLHQTLQETHQYLRSTLEALSEATIASPYLNHSHIDLVGEAAIAVQQYLVDQKLLEDSDNDDQASNSVLGLNS